MKIKQITETKEVIFSPIVTYSLIFSVVFVISVGGYMPSFNTILIPPIITGNILVMWNTYESKKKEKAFFQGFAEELLTNMTFLGTNKVTLDENLKHLNNRSVGISHLYPLKTENYDLLKVYYPHKIFKLDAFKRAMYVFSINYFNEAIKIRENYRISSDNLDVITNYEEYVIDLIERTNKFSEDLLNSEEVKEMLKEFNLENDLKKFYEIYEEN